MAFQDNSGDIILDVVLTDEGRKLLAAGDGTFNVKYFALGDDEINYTLFDSTKNTAQQDLTILQTPVLEAFTNNTASMKTKLFTLSSANANSILYLPVLKLNTVAGGVVGAYADGSLTNTFVVTADANTFFNTNGVDGGIGKHATTGPRQGIMDGSGTDSNNPAYIRIDGGFDTTNTAEVDTSIVENNFIFQMDDRLLRLRDKAGNATGTGGSVDDDNIKMYVADTATPLVLNQNTYIDANDSASPISGLLNTLVFFKLRANPQLGQSDYLFDKLGTTDTTNFKKNIDDSAATVKYIDTLVRVTGVLYGYTLEIPIRIVKL